jgi:hypothetical protein
MNKNKVPIFTLILCSFLLLGGAVVQGRKEAGASAQGQFIVEGPLSAETTETLLQYQGRLLDTQSGQPVSDGSYTMVLRLYDKPTGGNLLWMEAKDVPVQNGLFSTVLGSITPLDRELFDGRPLWLGIKVGADEEAAPRQQILPVAYALSVLPGAVVQSDDSSPALTLGNSGSGEALYTAGLVTVDGNLTVSGKINNSGIVTQYEFDDHIYGGMHNGRALAYGTIEQDCTITASYGNITCSWNNLGKYYEITIEGHTYDWRSYVTIVTTVTGGIPSAWSDSGKLLIGLYKDSTSPGMKVPFHFVTYKP